jgi:hypothetical protein
MTSECDRIRRTLDNNPNRKWGFVVYRCTYGDDAAWERSMDHLNTRTRLELQSDKYDSGDLFPYLDWSVQEDQSLDEAGIAEVRR